MSLQTLLDELLPGDGDFPSAQQAEIVELVRSRATATMQPDELAELEEATAAETLEQQKPGVFAQLQKIAFISYYETDAVQDVIRALGHRYNATPLPRGYPMGRFDPAHDAPRHDRGYFIRTEEVRRVDLSALDHLGPSHD